MVTQIIDTSASNPESFALNASAAVQLGPSDRIELSLEAIRRTESITYLAQQRQVSRKFVYKQLGKACPPEKLYPDSKLKPRLMKFLIC